MEDKLNKIQTLVDISNDFKEDYNYLLYRYSNGMVKRKKKHWYNFNRK